jgi:FtsH-binding integral membrane protein
MQFHNNFRNIDFSQHFVVTSNQLICKKFSAKTPTSMLHAISFVKPVRRVFKPSNVKCFSNWLNNKNNASEQDTIAFSDKRVPSNALQSFLNKTYKFSGAGVLTTLGVATALSSSSLVAQSPGMMVLGGFGLSLAGIAGVTFGKYHTDSITQSTTNSTTRLLGAAALVTGTGITSAPAFAIYDLSSILPPSLLMTTMVFSGASVYAYRAQPGSFLKYGPALAGGLLGLVGTGLVGIGSELVFGPNMFSMLAHNVNLYAGIPLFSAFVAYDTHVATERFASGDPDHLSCSMNLYLDFMNILVRMMKIVQRSRRD